MKNRTISKALSLILGTVMVLTAMLSLFTVNITAASAVSDEMTGTAPSGAEYINVTAADGSSYNTWYWTDDIKAEMGMSSITTQKVYKPTSATEPMILTYEANGASKVVVGNIDHYGRNVAHLIYGLGWKTEYYPTEPGVIDVNSLLWTGGNLTGESYTKAPNIFLPYISKSTGKAVLETFDTNGMRWKTVSSADYRRTYMNLSNEAPDASDLMRPIQVEYTLDGENWIAAPTTMTKLARGYYDGAFTDLYAEQWEADIPVTVEAKQIRVIGSKFQITGDETPANLNDLNNIGVYNVEIYPLEEGTVYEIEDKMTGTAADGAEYSNIAIADGSSYNTWYWTDDIKAEMGMSNINSQKVYKPSAADEALVLTYDVNGATKVTVGNIDHYGRNVAHLIYGMGWKTEYYPTEPGVIDVNSLLWTGGNLTGESYTKAPNIFLPYISKSTGKAVLETFDTNGMRWKTVSSADYRRMYMNLSNEAPDASDLMRPIQVEYTLDGENWIAAPTTMTKLARGYYDGAYNDFYAEQWEAELPENKKIKQVRVIGSKFQITGDETPANLNDLNNIGIYGVKIDGKTPSSHYSYKIEDAMTGVAIDGAEYSNIAIADGSSFNTWYWADDIKAEMGMSNINSQKVYKPSAADEALVLTYDANGATKVTVGNIDHYGRNVAHLIYGLGWKTEYYPTEPGVIDVNSLLWTGGNLTGESYTKAPNIFLPYISKSTGKAVLETFDTNGMRWKTVSSADYRRMYMNLSNEAPDASDLMRPIQVEYTVDGENWIAAPTTMTKLARGYYDGAYNDFYAEQWEAELPEGVQKVRVIGSKFQITGDETPANLNDLNNIGIYNVTIDGKVKIEEEPEEPVLVTGDINGDGEVNVLDIIVLRNDVLGKEGLTSEQLEALNTLMADKEDNGIIYAILTLKDMIFNS